MRWVVCLPGLMSVLLSTNMPVLANDLDIAGSVGIESRFFPASPQFPDQFDDLELSAYLEPRYLGESRNQREQFEFTPFARLDSQDQRRSHADIRELYWRHIDDNWELLAGVSRVFWGVAEFRHLVDIINQTDLVEDIDGEEKLGQPMLNLLTQHDWGDVSLYVMPWFRERTFPGKNGRLRYPLVTDGNAQYQSGNGRNHIDVAARYSHYLGNWDFGIAYFNGTGREPRLVLNENGTRLVPVYDLIK